MAKIYKCVTVLCTFIAMYLFLYIDNSSIAGFDVVIFSCRLGIRAFSCTLGEFPCGNMTVCIKQKYQCDGEEDCPNGADETYELCRKYDVTSFSSHNVRAMS